MTLGELARMFNEHFEIGCDLQVVKMEGWERQHWLDETDAPWVMPSPNIPTLDSATVFPGAVHFEGTQLSVGRGTTRPFELIGAPYVNPEEYARTWYRQNPPLPRVKWSQRDNNNYEQTGLLTSLHYFAENGTQFLRNFYFKSRRSIEKRLFDLRPGAIIRDLDLLRPIYAQTAAYGHFGRTDIELPWEQTNKVEELKASV